MKIRELTNGPITIRFGVKSSPICKLNARWAGARPERGHWLKAARGRTAYEVLSVKRRKPFGRGYTLVLTVLRHPPSEIPPGAVLHLWRWDKRERRKRRVAK